MNWSAYWAAYGSALLFIDSHFHTNFKSIISLYELIGLVSIILNVNFVQSQITYIFSYFIIHAFLCSFWEMWYLIIKFNHYYRIRMMNYLLLQVQIVFFFHHSLKFQHFQFSNFLSYYITININICIKLCTNPYWALCSAPSFPSIISLKTTV